MDAERISVEGRARVHAALGDPGRLRIVDLLGLGDASPAELGDVLAMPSNLLAHHLKVLESAGLVSRRRSDADARRVYLRLRPDTLAGLAIDPLPKPDRVVFVCTANSARSQLAAALWRGTTDLPVASAGTHPAPAIAPGAIQAARRHRLSLEQVSPKSLGSVLRNGDLVVTVCDNAHEELGGTDQIHWSVPDPVLPSTATAYDDVIHDLSDRVETLAARLN